MSANADIGCLQETKIEIKTTFSFSGGLQSHIPGWTKIMINLNRALMGRFGCFLWCSAGAKDLQVILVEAMSDLVNLFGT